MAPCSGQATQSGDLVVQKVHLGASQVRHRHPFGSRTKERVDIDGKVVQEREDMFVPCRREDGIKNKHWNSSLGLQAM